MSRRSIIVVATLASAALSAATGAAADGLPAAQTFTYTGGEQSYLVPAHRTS
jgi:hypothetical protein